MGSVRKAFRTAFGRCLRGSCYGVGFVTSVAVFTIMLWMLWCYFGLISFPNSEGQRRALVHYPITSSKPNLTTPPTSSSNREKNVPINSTSSERTTQNNILGTRSQATESRNLDQVEPNKDVGSISRTGNDKGDFDARDKSRTRSNTTDRSKGTLYSSDIPVRTYGKLDVNTNNREDVASTRERHDEGSPRKIDDDTKSISVRVVSSSAPENRPSIGSNKDSIRGEEKSIVSKIDYNIDDRKLEEPVPPRRIDDDDTRRSVVRDAYDEERRPLDGFSRDRAPPREYPDRDRRPLDSGSRRRDYYDDDLPRRRYDRPDDEYDRAAPPRRRVDDDEVRRRPPEDRRSDSSYDEPRSDRDYKYRDRDDDRYRPATDDLSRETDINYRYRGRYDDRDRPIRRDDDDRDRPVRRDDVDRDRPVRRDDVDRDRPVRRDDEYPERRDDRRRTSDADLYEKDRRYDDRYRDDDRRYRTRNDDETYRDRDDDRYRSGTVTDRYRSASVEENSRRRVVDDRPIDDKYRSRSEDRARDDIASSGTSRIVPTRTVDSRRADVLPRGSVSDVGVRVRDDYDTDRSYSRTNEKDERYVERVRGDDVSRGRPSRYKDDDLPDDLPLRSSIRSRPTDTRIDEPDKLRRTEVTDDSYRDRRLGGDDYDRPSRRRDRYDDDDDERDSRYSQRKGDDRVVNRDRPIYIAEDKELSRGLSPSKSEPSLDQRSYSHSGDDYIRNRPRLDPKLSTDDIVDRYPSSGRRSDGREERYRSDEDISRSSVSRIDDEDYRSKGDYGRDRIDRYDKAVDDRDYSRKESTYDDADRDRGTYSRDRIPSSSRSSVDDRTPPLREADYRPSDRRRYEPDPRPRRTDDDDYRSRDAYPDRYSSDSASRSRARDPDRSVVREKRDPVQPCIDRRDLRDRGDCEEELSVPHRTRVQDDRPSKPLSPKDVIDAAIKLADRSPADRAREVIYPVYDPRVGNITSPEVIRPSERRGTTITNRRKRK